MGKAELVAYCGIYCGDCLGYTGVIADAAEGFAEVLDRHQFERTAAGVFPEELEDYGRFREILAFVGDLRCSGICRQGEQDGGPAGCAVKNCCIDKGFYACYECDDFESCARLGTLHEGLHADACAKNMRAIRKKGLEVWLAEGPRTCYWMEGVDVRSGFERRERTG
jgi:hypothetical protein